MKTWIIDLNGREVSVAGNSLVPNGNRSIVVDGLDMEFETFITGIYLDDSRDPGGSNATQEAPGRKPSQGLLSH
jgi:hypothetical protein